MLSCSTEQYKQLIVVSTSSSTPSNDHASHSYLAPCSLLVSSASQELRSAHCFSFSSRIHRASSRRIGLLPQLTVCERAPMSQQKQEMKMKIEMAYRAMEMLGVGKHRVKPVLRRILDEYNYHWEHIEAESYRVLANAIFEPQDSQEGCSTDNNNAPQVAQGPREKRLKLSEDAMPSYNPRRDGPPCQPPLENRTPAQKRPLFEQSIPAATDKSIIRSVPTLPRAPGSSSKSKGEDLAVAVPHTGERSVVKCSRGTSCQSKSLLSLVEPKTESIPAPPGFGPLAVVHQSYVLDSPANSHPNFYRRCKGKTKGKEKKSPKPEDQGLSTNLEIIATSEVNLSFICQNELLCDPKFQLPSIEAVCQDVEERCLASCKLHDPNFSLLNVFKEMCHRFSELGYTPQQQRRNGNINIIPAPGAQHLFDGLSGCSPTPRPHYLDDISRGEELVQISIASDIDSHEECPLQFHYIARNIPYQNAYISISLARIGDDSCCSDCYDDCLQKPFACACASETAGVFAYTKEGLLRAEFLDACLTMLRDPKLSDNFYCKEACPLERVKNDKQHEKCKGHLMRKFIKECWAKCGCKRQCGNRIVQRGITCSLQVFKTGEQKGWGLRTMEDLPKGKFVCEYVGEILTNIELYDRQIGSRGNARHTYPVLLDADWSTERVLKDEEALCLDATYYGNVARFINHRCFDGNLIGIPVEIETPDHHYYHLAFFTTRDVSAKEELTWDYGIDFDDDKHPIKAFPCKCGSRYCRDRKRLTKARSRKLL